MTSAKEALIRSMTREAQEIVKHYITDFTVFDIPRIVESDDIIMYWFLRESGTHLIPWHTSTENIEMYGRYNDRMYVLNLQDGTLDKIWDREIDGADTLPKRA